MISIKLSEREVTDLDFAIDVATEQLDRMREVARTKEDKLLHEATSQRLVAIHYKMVKAAQKAKA